VERLAFSFAMVVLLAPTGARAGSGCGEVTIKGCCSGATLHYCVAGSLKQVDCSSSPKCGWNAALNYYSCGTAGGSDPSGTHAKACTQTTDAGAAPDQAAADALTGPDTTSQQLDSGASPDAWSSADLLPTPDAGGTPVEEEGACSIAPPGAAAFPPLLLAAPLLLVLARRRARP
jgi:hypothetical protein